MTEHAVGLTTTGGDPSLAYLDAGSPSHPAIVLLHSLGADHRMWEEQVAALATEWRVIAPDCRAHGASGGPGPITFHDWVADLDRVREHAQADQVALVGISLGGIQAMAYAADFPDRVSSLVIADSFAELDPETARAKISGLADRARAEGMAEWANSYVADTFTSTPPPPGAEVVRDAIAGMDEEAYAATARVCFSAQLAEQLGALRVPTLVLWGDSDRKTPRELSERIAANIPGAQFSEVPAAGHLSNLDNPAAFTVLVRDFLSTRDSRVEPGRR